MTREILVTQRGEEYRARVEGLGIRRVSVVSECDAVMHAVRAVERRFGLRLAALSQVYRGETSALYSAVFLEEP